MERRNKIVRKKTIKSILIIDCIVLFLGIIAIGPWPWNNDINRTMQRAIIIIVLVCIGIVDIYLWLLLPRIYLVLLETQESSLLVEKQLSNGKEVEIVPIRDDIPSLKALKKCSRFYAVYDGKDEVSISIKVNNDEKRFFESLHKKYFTSYYKLKENG